MSLSFSSITHKFLHQLCCSNGRKKTTHSLPLLPWTSTPLAGQDCVVFGAPLAFWAQKVTTEHTSKNQELVQRRANKCKWDHIRKLLRYYILQFKINYNVVPQTICNAIRHERLLNSFQCCVLQDSLNSVVTYFSALWKVQVSSLYKKCFLALVTIPMSWDTLGKNEDWCCQWPVEPN